MNIAQAKHLNLPKLLSKLGFEPSRIAKNGSELWYASPFRPEKEPSFHISFLGGKWIWNDFGDRGGTVIDFVMRFQNADVAGALLFLDSLFNPIISTAKSPSKKHFSTSIAPQTLTLNRVQPIGSTKSYLESQRCLSAALCQKYLVEVAFTNNQTGKEHLALAIKNLSDGYEVRNATFKGCIGKKNFSFLKGEKNNAVCLFEGFLDFPSCITDLTTFRKNDPMTDVLLSRDKKILGTDVIILNSASFKEPVLDFVIEKNYMFIHGFWDNDKTGLALKTYFEETLGAHRVLSWHHLYAPHKDYNEALVAKIKAKKV